MALRILCSLAMAALGGRAQEVQVYSEFQRVDPFGNVVAADRAELPREILSPALLRNAYASFQVIVTAPAGEPHFLFIGQNPDNAVRVSMYRVVYVQRGESWIPDGLEPLKLSAEGQVPDVAPQAPGQKLMAYWMDVWVRPNAPVRRTRLEVQLNAGDRWVIYPLELRMLSPVAPSLSGAPETALAAVEAPACASAAAVLRAYVCGAAGKGEEGPLTIRQLIRRNARQDVALAGSLEKIHGKLGLVTSLLDSLGATDRQTWCAAPSGRGPLGAEWYLKVRDYLYRTASAPSLSELPQPKITVTPVK